MKNKKLLGKVAYVLAASFVILSTVGCSNRSDVYTADYNDVVSYAAAPARDQGSYFSSKSVAADGAYEYEEAAEESYTEEAYDAQLDSVDSIGTNAETGAEQPNVSEADLASTKAESRKLIKTVNLSVESTEYENTLATIEAEVSKYNGYIENEYTYNGSQYDIYASKSRNATVTVRIPDEHLDEFLGTVGNVSNVVSKNTSTEDVTLRYVDIEGKKEMYRAEEKSLLELLEKAETVEDITYLVRELSEVRYQIESMESTLRTYDNLVDYATVNISLCEVEVLTPVETEEKSTKDIIKEGFKASMDDIINSLKNTGISLLVNSPYILRALIIMAIVIGIIYLAIRILIAIIKKCIKKAKAKHALKAENNKQLADNAKTEEKRAVDAKADKAKKAKTEEKATTADSRKEEDKIE